MLPQRQHSRAQRFSLDRAGIGRFGGMADAPAYCARGEGSEKRIRWCSFWRGLVTLSIGGPRTISAMLTLRQVEVIRAS